MMREDDFTWIKGRIDDLAKKWTDDNARATKNYCVLRDALHAIMKVERDDKGNHYDVIRGIADEALNRVDY